jgi:uncharacterized caspase-like protein
MTGARGMCSSPRERMSKSMLLNRKSVILAIMAGFLLACPDTVRAQDEGRRLALVIGNDDYEAGPLANAVNDARAMNRSLRGAGFNVILAENANRVAMEEALAEFVSRIGPGDVALFYFAGHAVQIEKENLLLPTDFKPGRNFIESRLRAVSAVQLFDYLKMARPKTTIVILDACRSNPAASVHSLRVGLATPQNAGRETYMAFSTSPDSVASDNPEGRNSWFTEELAEAITQPGLTIDDVFTRVRQRVEGATGGAQTPWSQSSLTAKFFFHPPREAGEEADTMIVSGWWESAVEHERRGDWAEAVELAGRVLRRKPGGAVEAAAQARLPYLQARHAASQRADAEEFEPALAEYEKALQLDAFGVDAAFEAATAALLIDRFDRAVPALEAVRARGASPDAARAEAMLRQIAEIEPVAAAALKRAPPPPPPIQELFPERRFGVPDWDAGLRMSRRLAPVDYAEVAQRLAAPPSGPAAEPGGYLVDVRAETAAAGRDLMIEGYGELAFVSELPSVTVMVNGRPVTRKLPHTLRLPAGNYEVRVLLSGDVLNERKVQIGSAQRVELEVK